MSRQVLIVEDATDTLELLQALFEVHGYNTTLCKSSIDALDVAQHEHFDLIISDIGLPEMDGLELIRRLRAMERFAEAPAVALTGYAAQTDMEKVLDAGFNTHISKPVNPTEMMEKIEQLLALKS